jgi:flagellar protein FliS
MRPTAGGGAAGADGSPVDTVAAHYLAEKVATASPGQLTQMLFDAAVSSLRRAAPAVAAQDRATARPLLLRAQDIVFELRFSLDLEAGGEIARNLDALYGWCVTRLIDANVRADAAGVDDALAVLVPLQETWREVCAAPVSAA